MKKEGIARALQVQTLSQQETKHDSGMRKERGGRKREWGARHYVLTRIIVVRSITGSRRAPPPACVAVVVFEPCTLTMVMEGGMGLRELEMPVLCGISTSTKLWAADSLTGAVVIMVIIVVERIQRSRREEVDVVSSNGLLINQRKT